MEMRGAQGRARNGRDGGGGEGDYKAGGRMIRKYGWKICGQFTQ